MPYGQKCMMPKQPSLKKVCGPQESHCKKKDVKSKVAAKKWL